MTPAAPTVLVADDDPLARMVVEAALAGAGYAVLAAEDGADAVRVFQASRPDCVLLDVMMPVLDGFAACRAIRAHPAGGTVPILVLTSRDDVEAIASAYAAGATDFAQKGLNPRLLSERVRFLLRTAGLQRGLAASQARLANAQRVARIGHLELARDGSVLDYSPVLTELVGLPPSAVTGRDALLAALAAADGASLASAIEECWRTPGGPVHLEVALPEAAGVRRLRVDGELGTTGGSAPTLTLTLQDVTRLRRAEAEVRQLAYYDAATRLPNRRFTRERLRRCLRAAGGTRRCGVLVLRIDDVERVIGSLGSTATEELLRRSASRLEEALAAAMRRCAAGSGPAPFVAHFGHGEFVVVLPGCESARNAEALAHDLVASIHGTLRLDGRVHAPTAHAGIAIGPDDGPDADSLLEHARAALRQAEDGGTERAFYSAELQARSRRRLQVQGALAGALERGELRVVYQPRIDLQRLEIAGAEALLRWRHPDLGDVPPDVFVPIAEETGAIRRIGAWVLETAIREAATWPRPDLGVSVNLSPRQALHPDLERTVDAALASARLDAARLELELTETCMMQTGGAARRVLERLRSRGVRIAIDDFGTGYSSLQYLGRLPLDVIKIDRSFAAGLPGDKAAAGVIGAVTGLARSLRARTVAEGIETAAQYASVVAHGCDEGQGFLFARPLEAPEFAAWCVAGVDAAARTALQAAR